jgi:hypothetical protein
MLSTRWFKYDWDDLCVNKLQFVPVIFEPPCIIEPRDVRLHCEISGFCHSVVEVFALVDCHVALVGSR